MARVMMLFESLLSYIPHCWSCDPIENTFVVTKMVQPKRSSQAVTNQLVRAVSPFEELLPRKTSWYDSGLFPHEVLAVVIPPREDQTRQEKEAQVAECILETREDIPTTIAFRTFPEDTSQVSIEAFSETRTLTPHPSFDKPSITAIEFHHLYQAARNLDDDDDIDWPSDEDEPLDGCGCAEQLACGTGGLVNKNRMALMKRKNLDETWSRQSETSCYEI